MLRQADRLENPVFSYDEVKTWSRPVLKQLSDLRLVVETGEASQLSCDGCPERHILEVEWRSLPDRRVAIAKCPSCGRVEIKQDRLRQWSIDFSGFANTVARSSDWNGGVSVEFAGRLAFVGTVVNATRTMDLFIGRGLTWRDTEQVLGSSRRLLGSANPVVFAFADLPTSTAHLPLKPAFRSISECALIQNGCIRLNLSTALGIESIPHQNAGAPDWIKHTEAAKMLCEAISGLVLKHARGRVSAAAGRDEFKTNGKKRRHLRIDRHTFSTWLWEQREKGLDAEDDDEWARSARCTPRNGQKSGEKPRKA